MNYLRYGQGILESSDSSFLTERLVNLAMELHFENIRPSRIMRPRVYPDGSQWCALYGDDLQNGVAGFGSSPEEATVDFDKVWNGG